MASSGYGADSYFKKYAVDNIICCILLYKFQKKEVITMSTPPLPQTLPASDTVESGYLESMLDKFSSSYKLYWFKGIFTEIRKGKRILEYKRLVARMIAAAWYPVVYFNLSLGHSDKLADAIWYIHKELKIPREEQEEKIVEFVYSSDDKLLLKKIKDFTNMVPYRLIRPFYQREIEFEKKTDHTFKDKDVNGLIEKYNKNDHNHALYVMDRMNGTLTVSKRWVDYIKTNAAVIEGWMHYKLIEYIQARNLNVPAIPFKIFPPVQRKLAEASKYWELVRASEHLPDLYTGQQFTTENLERFGTISIDHFIPWSFVLHNEIWNLYPAFKNINSQKGNKLPDLDRYLNDFCQYQFQAFQAAKMIPRINKKTMDQFLTINRDIRHIDNTERGRDAFVTSLRQTIEPLYQIANNQGYGIWWYNL